ncbi:MAG: glycerate kinase [Planctomycetes bacterium]|nr:glycerate kinase [Planctomycetota bacterium]
MKIVIAPDKFKGSLSAGEACRAIAEGVRRVVSDVELVEIPMADGGEGTVAALVAATGGELRSVEVCGPLGDKVDAVYGILGDLVGGESKKVKTAVIEMASAAGLVLVEPELRNPLDTTTYGVGQLILDGLERGCRDFVIGIGGSATNDCGCGMGQALGVRFLDDNGEEIQAKLTGGLMGQVVSIDLSGLDRRIAESRVVVACDVENPLLGVSGASYVYGPQKGADEGILKVLEANMAQIIGLIEGEAGREVRDIAGAGAAGGLGAGMMAFLGGKVDRGIEIVMRYCNFAERIRGAQLLITGEGRIDRSTVFGKTISGIATEAVRQSVPVVALAGTIEAGWEELYDIGVTAVMPICSHPMSLEEAMDNGAELLAQGSEQALRLAQIHL